MILLSNRIKEDKIVQYHVGQRFLHQANPGLVVFPIFLPGCLEDPNLPGLVSRKTLNLYTKFQFIGNFEVLHYYMRIVGPHFQWLEFHIQTHGMAGKQCIFSAQKAGKGHFLKIWLGFQL